MQDDHLKINESSFLVRNSKAIDMIRREIVDFFDKTDELFIGKIHKNDWTSWHLGKKRRDWIEEFVERS